jgi:Domain of unknown function (DUF4287)/Activator of Hsp90 ATPase homolog 1-like protein
MTTQQSFKRRVRARMEKTGESYTAARAQLLPDPEPEYRPRIADEKVEAATGHVWRDWFDLLDEWGAAAREHKAIAAWLIAEHGIPGWWAQGVTVEYEKARGLRPIGGDRDGTYNVSASRTIAVPVERLFEAWSDPEQRARWLGDFELTERTSTPPRGARYDWDGGSSRLIVLCESKGESKSTVALSHERLPDAGEAARLKAFWRGRMSDLKALLES